MKALLAGLILFAASLAGCDGAARQDFRTIGNLIDHMHRAGLSIGRTNTLTASLIGAAEGKSIEVFGVSVEVFRYDMNSESQKLTLERIRKEKALAALGIVVPATVNGSFVLASYHDHPEKERILRAFNAWDQQSAGYATPSPALVSPGGNLLAAFNGVWSVKGEKGLFKFMLAGARKVTAVVDSDRKSTNLLVRVASADEVNRTVNLVLDRDPSKMIMTLKQNFLEGSSTKFNLLFTLGDGQRGEMNFVRNIDPSDDFTVPDTTQNKPLANQEVQRVDGDEKANTEPPLAPLPIESRPPAQSTIFAPSFDCAKVLTGPERLICSSQELAELDVRLGQLYRQAINVSPDKEALKNEQIAWRKSERDGCADSACILNAYRRRITELSR